MVREIAADPGGGGGKNKGGKTKRASEGVSKDVKARIAARKEGQKLEILLSPDQNVEEPTIGLRLHSGSDQTCVQPLTDEIVKFKVLESDDQKSTEVTEAELNSLKVGKPVKVSVQIIHPSRIPSNASIKVLLRQRTKSVQESTK